MQNVIEKLIEFSKQIDLKERFDFNFDLSDPIFDANEIVKLSSYQNSYEQNVSLKWIISEKYKKTTPKSVLDFWIVNNWGGIRGFKPNSKNIEKVERFKKQLDKKKLSLDCFSTISSLSKIASFIDPENYVIYDSRVIYTLNWLILTCENQKGLKEKYFPMPSGRNKIITDFNMNTIVHAAHIKEYSNNTTLYISSSDAYFKYCDFIKTNCKLIYGNNAKPFELEMLLFTLANKEIFEDLKNRLSITINP